VTASPEPDAPIETSYKFPVRLLTIAEYQQLGEIEFGYTELQEGHVLLSPSPVPDHNTAMFELGFQLRGQVPAQFEVIPDMDVDLELDEPDQPGFSRQPDLVIADRAGRVRVRAEGGMLRASEVLIAVEIVSPGSKRTDYVIKRGEYADAGIPHYWILDLDEPVSLVDCHLAEGFGYQDAGGVTGTFETTAPFPVRVELDKLF
jgi:Uma2 family endonuclease